ncbi:hypothetical protein R3P38DRAFT_3288165 [Favolaschia claudopus]|uniref:Uncharacterized protein n=1 Tax=Favolaschia claudopus TaxID=2862362 RepID=A0AAV9ZXJ0_9AGAR
MHVFLFPFTTTLALDVDVFFSWAIDHKSTNVKSHSWVCPLNLVHVFIGIHRLVALFPARVHRGHRGPLIGGILAVISVIFAFFLWRYLLLRRRKRQYDAAKAAIITNRNLVNLDPDFDSVLRKPDIPPQSKKVTRKRSVSNNSTNAERMQAKAVMRQQYLANELRAIEKQREALLQVQQQMRGTGASTMGEVDSDMAVQSSMTTESAGGIDRTPREQDLERQNELLRQRIRYLEEQQRSDWARGLSDLPPPGYSEAPI